MRVGARRNAQRSRAGLAVGALSAALAVLLAGCGPEKDDGAAAGTRTPAPRASHSATPAAPATATPKTPAASPTRTRAAAGPRSVLAVLDRLTVKGRAPRTGYARDRFGTAWTDTDGNHCDTRDDILGRDLTGRTYRGGRCIVVSGALHDPYTGTRVQYVRGHSLVDIDHVVALSDAWQKGAQRWPQAKRTALANDPLNLLAVDSATNRGKGDGDAATWLPPNKAFRPQYVARQVAVKDKYGLSVTAAEKAAMRRVLTGPGGASATLPTGGAPTLAPGGTGGTGTGTGTGTDGGTTGTPPAAPAPTRSPTATPYASGDILTPSGKRYRSGQFCAARHEGLTTHDDEGRLLTCGPVSGRLRWHT